MIREILQKVQDHEISVSKAMELLGKDPYGHVEAKPTAEASLVEFPCPTCGAERFKTERRLNGDSWCRFGHKHPTKDFVRPAPPAVEELVRELKSYIEVLDLLDEHMQMRARGLANNLKKILAKYDERGQAK